MRLLAAVALLIAAAGCKDDEGPTLGQPALLSIQDATADAEVMRELARNGVRLLALRCAGGGGQPIHDGTEMAEARGNVLWSIDKKSPVRFSHENPEIQTLYREYLRAPLSGRSHHLLHTDHEGWKMPNQK